MILTRRKALQVGAAGAGGLLLTGCDALNDSTPFKDGLADVGRLHELTQRAIIGDSLAREFTEADMSPVFKANGSLRVADPTYRALLAGGFGQWALRVDGLVHVLCAVGKQVTGATNASTCINTNIKGNRS